MTSLALSLVVTAVMAAALQELRVARRELERGRAEFALAGVQAAAVRDVMQDGRSMRYRWRLPSSVGPVEVLAEPESSKMSLPALAEQDDAALAQLGVVDPEGLRARLRAAAAANAGALATGRLDSAPLWRSCAASMTSPYGRGSSPALTEALEPGAGRFDWRPAQVWRLRASLARGWVEERVVRFTGDPEHPAAVVERRLYKGGWEGERCSALIMKDE